MHFRLVTKNCCELGLSIEGGLNVTDQEFRDTILQLLDYIPRYVAETSSQRSNYSYFPE